MANWYYIKRKTLYLLSLIFILVSLGTIIYFTINLFLDLDNWEIWLIKIAGSIIAFAIFCFLYVIRKSLFPLPGIDYK